jgi:uncharacterized membrane protein
MRMAGDPRRRMISGARFLSLLVIVLMPLLFVNLMTVSLMKLRLTQHAALWLITAPLIGSLINVPVHRITRTEVVMDHPLAVFGLADAWPVLRRFRSETIVVANVGGCVIPVGLVFYEMYYLVEASGSALLATGLAAGSNVILSYLLARPVPQKGIVMPAFFPAVAAAASACLFVLTLAPQVAFVATVTGPIVGADLLHLNEFEPSPAGVLTIGGAGTFDGIILCGILAAYLARNTRW